MKKKLIFHISICLILFFALTAIYIVCYPKHRLASAEYEPSAVISEGSAPITKDGVTYVGDEIWLSAYPTLAHPGDNVKIEIKGKANTLYDINVYYPSGVSTAKALVDKQADENGIAAWEFKLSSKTTAEKLRVVIRSDGSYVSFYIPVEKIT